MQNSSFYQRIYSTLTVHGEPAKEPLWNNALGRGNEGTSHVTETALIRKSIKSKKVALHVSAFKELIGQLISVVRILEELLFFCEKKSHIINFCKLCIQREK